MIIKFYSALVIALAVLAGIHFQTMASAEPSTLQCKNCGSQDASSCCRLVSEEKKVTVTCWGFSTENFCSPGPSKVTRECSDQVCTEADPAGKTCFTSKVFSWREWRPIGTPKIFTKRKLMKRTVTKTIPSEKWVVECLCDQCRSKIQSPSEAK